MTLIEKIQRDIDEIAEFGYCNYPETFKTLIEAKKRIVELEALTKKQADGEGGKLIFPLAEIDKELLNSIADRLDYQYENPNNDVSIILKYCSKSLRDLVKKLNKD